MQGIRALTRDDSREGFKKERLATIVRESLGLVNGRFRSRGIEIRFAPLPEGLELFCSPAQIGQVLLHLLSNAFDAVSEQSERWVELAFVVSGEVVEIRLSDSGPGIPKELVARIFQPFFTTKPKDQGTGLGLGLAASIAQRHHGKLWLYRENSRTCFVLELPIIAPGAPGNPA